jgi:RNA-binding protein
MNHEMRGGGCKVALNPRQRAYLKSLAHPLKPILQIGKEGVTEAVKATIDGAFRTRELLKVKVLETSPEATSEVARAVAEGVPGAELVQVIGRTIVLYRRHATRPEIELPRGGA